MATLIRYDQNQPEVVFPADEEGGFSLEEIYTLVGCRTVETISLPDGSVMLIDEEGKFRSDCQARFNERASELLYTAGGMAGDWITGNALICTGKEFQ